MYVNKYNNSLYTMGDIYKTGVTENLRWGIFKLMDKKKLCIKKKKKKKKLN